MFAGRAALLTKRHELLGARAGRIAFATLAGIALVVAIGIAALWPGENAAGARPTTVGGVEAATVLAVQTGPACASFESEGCQVVKFEVTSGTRFKGERASLVLSGRDAAPTIEPGDAIRVARLYTGDVVPQTPFGQDRVYAFIDFERRSPLLLFALAFVVLGVLDDVTVSQASTVLALHRTDPTLRLRLLVLRARDVGRDHLGATVNTLALAYAGAALPLLLVFQARDATVGDVLNREPVATALAAAIVGSIGLILAVPLTTVVAALLARAVPPEELPNEQAHHH